ncbi:MAG: glycosyltransferase family 2 protein [Acidimicrobiia bacterium]|nr:glycosyltransferase family 2 protein [Acidimicrobiia bacterium]
MRGADRTVVAAAGVAAVGAIGWTWARRTRAQSVRRALDSPTARPAPPGEFRLSVVVPAYREPDIGASVAVIRQALADVHDDGGVEVIVVDDGSHDGTAERASEAGADRVVRQPVNRGKGAAVRAGMLVARGRTVAFTDADLAYSPDHLLTLLAEVESGWDVVVGSRRHTDTTTLVRARRVRELGGRAINLLTRVVLLGHHRDTQCGLKAFRGDVARILFSHSHVDGFAFDVELFLLVERYGFSLHEVPVTVVNTGGSTVRVVRDAARLVRDLFRIRAWSALGVYDLEATESLDEPGGVAE